jgi:hypothetical protein
MKPTRRYLPISMYKHLSCAAFKIKLTTGSGNAGMCEKLHDRSRNRLRPKAGVCASTLPVPLFICDVVRFGNLGLLKPLSTNRHTCNM